MYKALTVIISASLFLAACGSSSVEKEGPLGLKEKKARLDSLKTQQGRLGK
jgi:hypothetical protein